MGTPYKRQKNMDFEAFTRQLTSKLIKVIEKRNAEKRQKEIDALVEKNLIEEFGIDFSKNEYTLRKFTPDKIRSYSFEKLNKQIIDGESWVEGSESVLFDFCQHFELQRDWLHKKNRGKKSDKSCKPIKYCHIKVCDPYFGVHIDESGDESFDAKGIQRDVFAHMVLKQCHYWYCHIVRQFK